MSGRLNVSDPRPQGAVEHPFFTDTAALGRVGRVTDLAGRVCRAWLRPAAVAPIASPPPNRAALAPPAGCGPAPPDRHNRGFTLLEVLVATLIMGIAVTGLLSAVSAAARNAAHLTSYDRMTLLAKSKMDELLVEQSLPRSVTIQGTFDPAIAGGSSAGWTAVVTPFEKVPGAGPGQWVLDRIALEIWWMEGSTRHAFSLEGFRRSLL